MNDKHRYKKIFSSTMPEEFRKNFVVTKLKDNPQYDDLTYVEEDLMQSVNPEPLTLDEEFWKEL